jgi:hypothetical protein
MPERDDTPDGFLSRWSRRKALVREGAPLVEPAPTAVTQHATVAQPAAAPVSPAASAPATPAVVANAEPERPALTLDDVAQLTPESDYAAFAKRSVDPQVRNAAMKKLFTDPHYNVMDGLDTYIDDYNKSDPIPKSMLRQMVQARFLGLLDDELEEQPKPPPDVIASSQQALTGDDPPPAPNAEPAAITADAEPITADADPTAIDPAVTDLVSTHEDLDLQLQRHDADRQRGPHEPFDGQTPQRKPDQP